MEGLRRRGPPEDVIREHGVNRVDAGEPEVEEELRNGERDCQKCAHKVLGRFDQTEDAEHVLFLFE